MRDTDLEDMVLQFLKKIPKKRFVTTREIALAVTGHYPTAMEEKYVKEACLSLWEIHKLDDKRLTQTGYRLQQEKLHNRCDNVGLQSTRSGIGQTRNISKHQTAVNKSRTR